MANVDFISLIIKVDRQPEWCRSKKRMPQPGIDAAVREGTAASSGCSSILKDSCRNGVIKLDFSMQTVCSD